MKRVKIENFVSNSGRAVPNQFIIHTDLGVYFQSYDSIIAFVSVEGKVFLDENYWDYSVTTGKYRNSFLNEGIAETRRKIDTNEYILTDLN